MNPKSVWDVLKYMWEHGGLATVLSTISLFGIYVLYTMLTGHIAALKDAESANDLHRGRQEVLIKDLAAAIHTNTRTQWRICRNTAPAEADKRACDDQLMETQGPRQ